MVMGFSWPDPNSPVLSKLDFGVSLADLLLWLKTRDTLLGRNFVLQDVPAALALAQQCKHPDAVWLARVCKDVSTWEGCYQVFCSLENVEDGRAKCFSWYGIDRRSSSLERLVGASEVGSAFASSLLCIFATNMNDRFALATNAAGQLERDGFFELGRCLSEGLGCEKDLIAAKGNFLIAAELGHAFAAVAYGQMLDESDPDHWVWLGRAALNGLPFEFLNSFAKFCSGNTRLVFAIGRALNGSVDVEKREIFGHDYKFDSLGKPAMRAIGFYKGQLKACRLAVNTWAIVATRFGIVKDVRRLISKLIWEARADAIYSADETEEEEKEEESFCSMIQ